MLSIVTGNESGLGVINRVVERESGLWKLRMRSVNIRSVWVIRPRRAGGLRLRTDFYDVVSGIGKFDVLSSESWPLVLYMMNDS